MELKNKQNFIGPNQIFGIVQEEQRTPGGKEIVKVVYEGGKLSPETMPLATFEILVSEAPHDYNWLREKRYKKLLEEMTALCLETDVRYSDIKHLATKFAEKLDSAFERATNYLWTSDDKQWIPGINSLSDRTILEADKILKQIKPNDAEQSNTKP